ncbi:MAG: toprim domain-containing protein [Alphaproteobacteria bacterium]|nr:toprim domain-containing protein [Alphaproteobacteria bacterium]
MTKPHSGHLAFIPASDIAALLGERVEALCRHLLSAGHRDGAEWIEAARKDGGRGDSLRVHLTGAKVGIWSHFASGHGGDALDLVEYLICDGDKGRAIAWAKNWLGIGDSEDSEQPAPTPRQVPKAEKQDDGTAKRTEAALAIWRASQPASGTPVETYLRYRGIAIPIPPSLRYNPAIKYKPSGLFLPAMIAGVQSPARKIVAVHRTYLRLDGRGKAGVSTSKMALGPLGSGAVRLGLAESVLGIAEGIETGLSAMQLFEIPTWCALGSRLDRIALPEQVERVIIFADSGEAGMGAANKALDTFNEQGRQAEICVPDLGDFNDVLSKESAA